MKFTLIYDDDLPAAGNNTPAVPASKIRNKLHPQLLDLWQTHVVFRQLARTARTTKSGATWGSGQYNSPNLPDYNEPIRPVFEGQIDLCAAIDVPNVGQFNPVIRKSLHLACALDILFLRHEQPFNLMKNGGDIDNRLKTLFDGLRMPDPKAEYKGDLPAANPLCVLLEDDALISDVSIKSGMLLGDPIKNKHLVRLTIDVTIKVLRVTEQNQCLIGG